MRRLLSQLEPGEPAVLLIDVDFVSSTYALGSFTIEKKEADAK